MSDFQVSIRKSIRPCGKIFISFPSRPRRHLADVEFTWKWSLNQCRCVYACMNVKLRATCGAQARQQAANHELEAARLEAAKTQLNADTDVAHRNQVEASQSLMHAATSATSALHESAKSLAESQGQVARVTAEAVRQITEVRGEPLTHKQISKCMLCLRKGSQLSCNLCRHCMILIILAEMWLRKQALRGCYFL